MDWEMSQTNSQVNQLALTDRYSRIFVFEKLGKSVLNKKNVNLNILFGRFLGQLKTHH